MDGVAMRDVRLTTASDLEAKAPAPRCQVCDLRLPKGLNRRYCLEHSEYAQELMQRERRRRARRVRSRRAA